MSLILLLIIVIMAKGFGPLFVPPRQNQVPLLSKLMNLVLQIQQLSLNLSMTFLLQILRIQATLHLLILGVRDTTVYLS